MKVGLTLFGKHLTASDACFAAQLGVSDVVMHLVQYGRGADHTGYDRGEVGPPLSDCTGERLWSYEDMAGVVGMLAEHGLRVAALENFSPAFWSDILLAGPDRPRQMDNLKTLVRDAGRAGIPVIGYNFSIAGVWGWQRRPTARGGATTTTFDTSRFDSTEPLPDGVVWNMRVREAQAGAEPVRVSEAELWQRLEWFLKELVPVAEEAGVVLAAHPDDPPTPALRGTARLVNSHAKYVRLLGLVDSPANGLQFCLGSLQEMDDGGDIYETARRFARDGRIAYVHFRNVKGKIPAYAETFVDDGDIDMAEVIRILAEEGFDGVLIPDHIPEMTCPAPWHAGNAHAIGYMKALVSHAGALGASRGRHTAVAQ